MTSRCRVCHRNTPANDLLHIRKEGQKRSICKLCAVVHDVALKRAGWVFSYE